MMITTTVNIDTTKMTRPMKAAVSHPSIDPNLRWEVNDGGGSSLLFISSVISGSELKGNNTPYAGGAESKAS